MKKFCKAFMLILVVGVACFFAGCGKNKADIDEIGQQLTNYYMDINYNNADKSLSATQTIDYVNESDALLKEVYLHLYVASFCRGAKNSPVEERYKAKAYPNGENFANLNISRVKLNDQDISPQYEGEDNDIMKILLDRILEPTCRVKIYIEYAITIPNVSHRFGWTDSGVNIANFYPVMCVYDEDGWSKNPYHFNGDPFYTQMANYYVNFVCDSDLVCAFSGKADCKQDGKKLHYSISSVCVRDFAIMLSPKFKTETTCVDDVEYTYYYINDQTPEKTLQCAVDSVITFSKLFYPYPYKAYNVVQSSFLYGGMEYPMLSLISDASMEYADYLNVIVHETAHQWWYGIVGNDEYTYAWLDEALTEFSTLLFYDNNEGYALAHKDMIAGMQDNYNLFVKVYTDVLGGVDTSLNRCISEYDTSPEYTYCTYVKGCLMFESLYQLVGQTKFIKSLKLYAETYAYKIATPECLIGCFEKVTKSSLTNFFDCWITAKVVMN